MIQWLDICKNDRYTGIPNKLIQHVYIKTLEKTRRTINFRGVLERSVFHMCDSYVSLDNWSTFISRWRCDGGLGDSGQVCLCLCLCGLPSGPRCRLRGGWWMGLIAGVAQCRVALSVLQPAGLSAWCVCCRRMLYGPLPVCLASRTGTCTTKTRPDTTLLSSGTFCSSTFFCSDLSFSLFSCLSKFMLPGYQPAMCVYVKVNKSHGSSKPGSYK